MTTRTKPRRPRKSHDPRDAAEALGYDTGSRAIPVVIEHVAVGTRGTRPQVMRRSNVAGIEGVTEEMAKAAEAFVRAWEHLCEGCGMGPMDLDAEKPRGRHGDGLGVVLLPQERAMSAAEVHRIGTQAAGIVGSALVHWVAIDGRGLRAWEQAQGWRNGRAADALRGALSAMADAYGFA